MGLLRQFLEGSATVAECRERIARREPAVRAWVEVVARDEPGIPFGAKDIFESAGLATEYGSPVYAGRKGSRDAALIGQLKQAGFWLLGKTHTTAFAYYDPAPTRNPRHPGHTPGGSSSGSAAAVAAGMVPLAIGTQTQGSVVRPASFCGVCGFKPTYGLLPADGALAFAPSLDTVGFFTEDPEDMALLWKQLGFAAGIAPARLAIPRSLPEVEPLMESAFAATLARLRAAGWAIEAIDLPLDGVVEAVRIVNAYEGARQHEARWREHGDRIGTKLAQLVVEGLAMPESRYREALALLRARREEMRDMPHVLATPAAPGPAPAGLASTGDPRCNSAWTGLGFPALSVPMPVDPDALPLGLQLAAAPGRDATLLAAAAACYAAVDGRRQV